MLQAQAEAAGRGPTRFTIGCLGSRGLLPDAARACRQIAADLVRGGYSIVTGATPGEPGRDPWADWADGAFAYGAACVAPAALTACLPWRHFPRGSGAPAPGITLCYPEDQPEWTLAAADFWAATHNRDEGGWMEAEPRALRLRHTRNVGIVLMSRLVLAWPHGEAQGTRFAMRFAAWCEVPLLDLTQTSWWMVAPALVARLARG
jgi:hypothetical protein